MQKKVLPVVQDATAKSKLEKAVAKVQSDVDAVRGWYCVVAYASSRGIDYNCV